MPKDSGKPKRPSRSNVIAGSRKPKKKEIPAWRLPVKFDNMQIAQMLGLVVLLSLIIFFGLSFYGHQLKKVRYNAMLEEAERLQKRVETCLRTGNVTHEGVEQGVMRCSSGVGSLPALLYHNDPNKEPVMLAMVVGGKIGVIAHDIEGNDLETWLFLKPYMHPVTRTLVWQAYGPAVDKGFIKESMLNKNTTTGDPEKLAASKGMKNLPGAK